MADPAVRPADASWDAATASRIRMSGPWLRQMTPPLLRVVSVVERYPLCNILYVVLRVQRVTVAEPRTDTFGQ